jgi:hypothetical protein
VPLDPDPGDVKMAFACCAVPHRIATTITNAVKMNFAVVIMVLLLIKVAFYTARMAT